MAQPNIFVIATVFCGFTVQLLNSVLFFVEIPYWFGFIWNTLGVYLSVALFIKADCVQGVWYNEVYESDQTYSNKHDVIELADNERSQYNRPSHAPATNRAFTPASQLDQMSMRPMTPTQNRGSPDLRSVSSTPF